jgi:hypothetical protein
MSKILSSEKSNVEPIGVLGHLTENAIFEEKGKKFEKKSNIKDMSYERRANSGTCPDWKFLNQDMYRC